MKKVSTPPKTHPAGSNRRQYSLNYLWPATITLRSIISFKLIPGSLFKKRFLISKSYRLRTKTHRMSVLPFQFLDL